MAYSAMVRKLLLSAPGDVPDSDWRVVVDTMLRWNNVYGAALGACVSPLRWRENAAAAHGVHPQIAINEQLVADADGVLALLWHLRW